METKYIFVLLAKKHTNNNINYVKKIDKWKVIRSRSER